MHWRESGLLGQLKRWQHIVVKNGELALCVGHRVLQSAEVREAIVGSSVASSQAKCIQLEMSVVMGGVSILNPKRELWRRWAGCHLLQARRPVHAQWQLA